MTKKMKKICSLVLCFAMLMSVAGPISFAKEEKKLEDYPEEVLALDVTSSKSIKD